MSVSRVSVSGSSWQNEGCHVDELIVAIVRYGTSTCTSTMRYCCFHSRILGWHARHWTAGRAGMVDRQTDVSWTGGLGDSRDQFDSALVADGWTHICTVGQSSGPKLQPATIFLLDCFLRQNIDTLNFIYLLLLLCYPCINHETSTITNKPNIVIALSCRRQTAKTKMTVAIVTWLESLIPLLVVRTALP